MLLNEVVFKSRNNVILLELQEDGVALKEKYPDIVITRFVLTLGALTIDSQSAPTAFRWIDETSVLEIKLGGLVEATAPGQLVKLCVYSNIWPQGAVWIHPTCTPDKLRISICE